MFVLIERLLHRNIDERIWERLPWRLFIDATLVVLIALIVWYDGM